MRIRAGGSKQKAIAQPAQAVLLKKKIEVTFRFIVRVLPRIILLKPPQVALAAPRTVAIPVAQPS